MQSAFGWPGGKQALLPTLLKLVPEHTLYCEAFAGSAKLLFAKAPSRREVLNDLNGDVINFFRVAKHRTAELAERLELECVHAGRFRELRAGELPSCEVDRALRFAYLTWYSFGAKGEHFASGSAKATSKRHPLHLVRQTLERTAARLAAVLIEQRDFAEILTRYDAPGTFFYLDPPYVAYRANSRYDPLDAARRVELFRTLARLKGKCLLSFDDHPEIRAYALEHGLQTRQASVRYSLAGTHQAKLGAELLIANYPLAA